MNISAKATFEMDNGNFSLSTVAFLLPSGPESHVINFTCLPLTHTRSFVKSHRFLRFIISQQLTIRISYTPPCTATTFDFSYLYSFSVKQVYVSHSCKYNCSYMESSLKKAACVPCSVTKNGEVFSLCCRIQQLVTSVQNAFRRIRRFLCSYSFHRNDHFHLSSLFKHSLCSSSIPTG